jgi:hypothetical protein
LQDIGLLRCLGIEREHDLRDGLFWHLLRGAYIQCVQACVCVCVSVCVRYVSKSAGASV